MPTQYATIADLTRLGCPAAALTSVDNDGKNAALVAASGVVDSYVGTRFRLPLTAVGDELKQAVASIAAWRLLSVRGLTPGNASADTLRLNYEDTMRWLRDVQAGRAMPSWPANAATGGFDPTLGGLGQPFALQPTPGDPPGGGGFDGDFDRSSGGSGLDSPLGTPQKPRSRGW